MYGTPKTHKEESKSRMQADTADRSLIRERWSSRLTPWLITVRQIVINLSILSVVG